MPDRHGVRRPHRTRIAARDRRVQQSGTARRHRCGSSLRSGAGVHAVPATTVRDRSTVSWSTSAGSSVPVHRVGCRRTPPSLPTPTPDNGAASVRGTTQSHRHADSTAHARLKWLDGAVEHRVGGAAPSYRAVLPGQHQPPPQRNPGLGASYRDNQGAPRRTAGRRQQRYIPRRTPRPTRPRSPLASVIAVVV